MFLFSFRGSQHSRMILRHLLRQRNLLPVRIQEKSTHNPNKIRLILPFLIYVCYVFNTKIRNYLPNWYQKTRFYFHRYGLPSYSGHSSILKKIACKHTTYRLSQSPFSLCIREATYVSPSPPELLLYILAIKLYILHTRSISPFRYNTGRSP